MHSFTFDGFNSRTYGIMVSGGGTYDAPKRDITSVEVPGRNGALTIDNGRFKNITVTYEAFIVGDFKARAQNVRAWLCAAPGYRRLTDDYDIDHYRLARFVSGLSFNTHAQNTAGKTNIQFDCDPRRFLTSGTSAVAVASGGSITNPTLFDALPTITVTGNGNGTLHIGSYTLTLTGSGATVTLDSEIKRAYSGTTPRDSTVSGQFPVLVPGANAVSFSGGITGVTITPRWWTV